MQADGEEKPEGSDASKDGEADTPKPRRRRRRKKTDKPEVDGSENNEQSSTEGAGDEATAAGGDDEDEGKTKRRRRGRRGGRKRRGETSETSDEPQVADGDVDANAEDSPAEQPATAKDGVEKTEQKSAEPAPEVVAAPTVVDDPVIEVEPVVAAELVTVNTPEPDASAEIADEPEASKPKKRGWWQRG